jgi:hypothetical protein
VITVGELIDYFLRPLFKAADETTNATDAARF